MKGNMSSLRGLLKTAKKVVEKTRKVIQEIDDILDSGPRAWCDGEELVCTITGEWWYTYERPVIKYIPVEVRDI